VSAAAAPTGVDGSDRILRFRKSERLVHWSIAIPFMVCYATAVILFALYYANPDRPYRDVFSWIHRLSGAGRTSGFTSTTSGRRGSGRSTTSSGSS
jgi:uncharacterized membrane protein YgcG